MRRVVRMHRINARSTLTLSPSHPRDTCSTVYKLNVHDNRRAFDEDGWDIVSNFRRLALPLSLREVQSLRAMRFAFEVVKGRPIEEYDALLMAEVGVSDIAELVITRNEWKEPALHNVEKVPFRSES